MEAKKRKFGTKLRIRREIRKFRTEFLVFGDIWAANSRWEVPPIVN